MKYIVTSVAALIALVQAIEITNAPVDPVAGEPFEITWQNAEGPVTLTLRRGDPNNLDIVDTITSGVESENGEGSFTWNVPDDLVPGDDYAFMISDGTGENYSDQFPLEGTGEATTDATTAASSTVTVTSTSTEASVTSETSEMSTSVTTVTSSEESSAASTSAESTESESSTATESEAATSTSDEQDEASTVPENKAGRLGSPAALVFTLAAMLYFH